VLVAAADEAIEGELGGQPADVGDQGAHVELELALAGQRLDVAAERAGGAAAERQAGGALAQGRQQGDQRDGECAPIALAAEAGQADQLLGQVQAVVGQLVGAGTSRQAAEEAAQLVHRRAAAGQLGEAQPGGAVRRQRRAGDAPPHASFSRSWAKARSVAGAGRSKCTAAAGSVAALRPRRNR